MLVCCAVYQGLTMKFIQYQLAQVNVGRLVAPIDDPRIAECVDQLGPVNALAERSPGFVWRLQSDSGNATDIVFNEDPQMMVNMSVWESVDALREYVYRMGHLEVLRKRGQWFESLGEPHACLWWVPEGHRPTVAEARERLEKYRTLGSTREAFWFPQVFGAPEAALGL